MKLRLFFRKLFQYFLQGVIILAPIAITIWAVTGFFNYVDNLLPDLAEKIVPKWLGETAAGQPRKIPGLGFVVVILVVVLVGYISSSFIVGRLVDLFDKALEKTPGVKIIYTTVKDFFEAFAGNKRKFNRAVIVCIDAPDIWRVGFITQENLHEFGLEDYVSVYVPQSYALAGNLYLVQRDKVRLVEDISSADAMKFAISGGVAEVDEDHIHHGHVKRESQAGAP